MGSSAGHTVAGAAQKSGYEIVRSREQGYVERKAAYSEAIWHRSQLEGAFGTEDFESEAGGDDEDERSLPRSTTTLDPLDVLTNKRVRWVWHAVVGCICFGFFVEDPWRPFWHKHRPPVSHGVPHIMLYAGYLWMALTTILASRDCLPKGSAYIGLVVSSLGAALTWYYHSLKQEGTEQVLHQLALLACVVQAIGALQALSCRARYGVLSYADGLSLMVRELAWLSLSIYGVFSHGVVMLMLAFFYFKATSAKEFLGNEHYPVEEWQAVCAAIGGNLIAATFFVAFYLYARRSELQENSLSDRPAGIVMGTAASAVDNHAEEEEEEGEDILEDVELESAQFA
eukprot:jgi/Bigna1/75404/fgenesh1_pg.34_\